MNKTDTIFVAGHKGLVGSAVLRRLQSSGYTNLLTRTHNELDLMDAAEVERFFAVEKPKHLVLAAARVGGILANATCSAEFIRENILIQTNVIHQAYLHGVEQLLFLGSSCIYPRDCPQPIREEYFMTGPLEKSNSAYAVAKIAGVEMCHAYNRQHGTKYLCLMPSNLYGQADNFDLETSHVLPSMIRKFHEGKINRKPVVLWGTGTPRREFLHADDMADACVHILARPAKRRGGLVRPDRASVDQHRLRERPDNPGARRAGCRCGGLQGSSGMGPIEAGWNHAQTAGHFKAFGAGLAAAHRPARRYSEGLFPI